MTRHITVGICLLFALTSLACDDTPEPLPTSPDSIPPEPAAEPEPEPEPEPVDEDSFALTLTNGYTGCFQEFDLNGSVDGIVNAVVASDGTVADASYAGLAPEPVQTCILDKVRSRTIDDYDGEPGLATFTYSGTYNNGIEMLSTSWHFRRYSELDSDGQATVEPHL